MINLKHIVVNKLDHLVRRNRRKHDIAEYKEKLKKIFNVIFEGDDFIDLEASDIVVSSFFNALKSTPKTLDRKYNQDQIHSLEVDITQLCISMDSIKGYLITSKSETCGVCKVNMGKALSDYKSLIELDGDSLSLFSMDEKSGIHIDFFEEYEDNILFSKYELCVWGWQI